MESITVSFALTKEEYLKAARKHLIVSGTISRLNIILVPLIVVVAAVYMVYIKFSGISIALFSVGVFALTLGCAVYFYIPELNYANTPFFRGECTYKFDEGFMEVNGETRKSAHSWEDFREVWRSSDFYYLIMPNSGFFIIPARCFSPGGEDRFTDLLQKKFDKIKKIGSF